MTTTLNDPALPGLPAALDVEAVRHEVQGALDAERHPVRLERVAVLDVQYRPGESCVVSYGLKLRPAGGGRSNSAHLAGWLHGPGTEPLSLAIGAPGRDGPGSTSSLPAKPIDLPALSMTVLPFPLDPALPGLASACDPGVMKELLSRRFHERGARVRQVRIERLGHVPGARAALTLEVLGEARRTGEPELRHLVGKMDGSRDAAAVFARGWAVWRAAALRVPIAPPVGFLPLINLSLQERVPGVRLSERATHGAFISEARRTARIVASLHDLSLPLASRRPPVKDIRSVRRWGALLASIRPASRGRIEKHAAALSDEIAARGTITGPVHGDLHPSNVLVDDGRVTLIDLDNMARGDRLADVGRFLSSLRTTSLRVHGKPNAFRDVGEAFLAAYLSLCGEDERRARLYESAALMVSAGSGFRLQRAGWEETADALIEESARALEAAARGPSVATRCVPEPGRAFSEGADAKPGPAPEDETREQGEMPTSPGPLRGSAEWLREGRLVLAAVAQRLHEQHGIDATRCEATRERESRGGRRVRYRITGWRGSERVRISALGIVRGRSVRGAFRRLVALREALAFRPDALSVAAPLGCIPELGLLVVEVPDGERFVPETGSLPGLAAVEEVGTALRALHETTVQLGRQDGVVRWLDELEKLARRSKGLPDEDGERVNGMMDALASAPAEQVPLATLLGSAAPRQIVRAHGRWTHEAVTDIALGDPRRDVAELAAGLARLGLAAGRGVVPGLRQRLRRAYAGDDIEMLRALPRIEASALLRAALLEARLGHQDCARAMLDAAEERLSAIARMADARILA